ncbi:MAG: hypothetical protein OEX02_20240 [Cyclobacteriaceae bacterium]|nr:hypothetical protein [Cyclobacteriaceae bacterium]
MKGRMRPVRMACPTLDAGVVCLHFITADKCETCLIRYGGCVTQASRQAGAHRELMAHGSLD